MIELVNIEKKFNNRLLFENLNLVISDGDFLVIHGESGAGKTTLLNIIGGLEEVDQGKIYIDGVELKGSKMMRHYYAECVGFLFQNFALIEHESVKKNIEVVARRNRSGISCREALKLVGLEDEVDKPVYELSGGEQQRVAVARLMYKKCKIILADEPTGSLDRRNADMIINYLKEMNNQGKTVIMVTHDEKYKGVGNKELELNKGITTVTGKN